MQEKKKFFHIPEHVLLSAWRAKPFLHSQRKLNEKKTKNSYYAKKEYDSTRLEFPISQTHARYRTSPSLIPSQGRALCWAGSWKIGVELMMSSSKSNCAMLILVRPLIQLKSFKVQVNWSTWTVLFTNPPGVLLQIWPHWCTSGFAHSSMSAIIF